MVDITLIGPTTRARLLRAILPPVVILSLAADWIPIILLERSDANVVFYTAMTDISFLLAVSYAIARASGSIGDAIDRTQAERRRAEETQALLAAIVEHSNDAIIGRAPDGTVTSWNAAAERILGYTAAEAIGRTMVEVQPPELRQHIAERRKLLLAGEPGKNREEVRVAKDGRRIEMAVSVSPIKDRSGKIIGTAAILRDITERKRAESALREAMFALTVAEERERREIAADLHDVPGQLLAAANLRLSGLSGDAHEAEIRAAVHGAREMVEKAQRSLRSLIYQVSPPVLFELGLVPALSWLAGEIQQIYGVAIDVHDDGKTRPIDPITRAIAFRAVREVVINAARHARVKTANVDVRREGGRLIVSVTDYGVGFNQENISKKRPGGGFGLLSIRERLGFVGGEIEIDSAPGDGTVVTLSVPMSAGAGASGGTSA